MAELTARTVAELTELDPVLRVRVEALIWACPVPIGITSAWRSPVEQQRLYDGWVRRLPGFNPANPPGRSLHERTSPNGAPAALAADLALPGAADWRHWVHAHADQFGLHFPIRPRPGASTAARRRGEPWHVESNGQPWAPPVPAPPAVQEDEMQYLFTDPRDKAQYLRDGGDTIWLREEVDVAEYERAGVKRLKLSPATIDQLKKAALQ